MSVSEMIIKIIGVILAIVGLYILVTAATGLAGAGILSVGLIIALVVGALLIGAGVIIVRGGSIVP